MDGQDRQDEGSGGHGVPCPYGASIGVLRLFTYLSQGDQFLIP